MADKTTEFLRNLVDWAYLHATEGTTWPSTKTADELIAKASFKKADQSDADAMRRSHPQRNGERT